MVGHQTEAKNPPRQTVRGRKKQRQQPTSTTYLLLLLHLHARTFLGHCSLDCNVDGNLQLSECLSTISCAFFAWYPCNERLENEGRRCSLPKARKTWATTLEKAKLASSPTRSEMTHAHAMERPRGYGSNTSAILRHDHSSSPRSDISAPRFLVRSRLLDAYSYVLGVPTFSEQSVGKP